jgi:hypothetical protein
VEFGPDGLVLHDTVREVVAALLRVSDPLAYRAHKLAAWRQSVSATPCCVRTTTRLTLCSREMLDSHCG